MKYKYLILLIFALFTSQLASAAVSNQEVSTIGTKHPFTYTGFSLAVMDAEHNQKGGGGFSTYNFVSAHYRVDYQSKFVLRVPFFYSSAGYDDFNSDQPKKSEIALADVIVEYARNAYIPFAELDVYWANRIYIPTSDNSRNQKMVARFRTEAIFTKALTKHWELEYWPKFNMYAQSQTTFENDFGTFSNTKSRALDHWATIWYKVNPKLSFGAFIGGEDNWFNSSDITSTSRAREGRLSEHSIKMGPSIAFTLSSNFNFIFNVTNQVDLHGFRDDRKGVKSDLGKFKARQTEFALLSFIRF